MGNCFKRQRKSDIPASSNSQTENLQDKSNLKLKAPKSWETRPKLKKEDFEFKNRENETLIKKPGLLFLDIFYIYLISSFFSIGKLTDSNSLLKIVRLFYLAYFCFPLKLIFLKNSKGMYYFFA